MSNAFERDDVLGCYGRQLIGMPQAHGLHLYGREQSPRRHLRRDRGESNGQVRGREITRVYGWSDDQQRKITLSDVVDQIAQRCEALCTKFVYGDQGQAGGLLALFAQRGIQFRSMSWSQASKEEAVTHAPAHDARGDAALA